MVAAYASVPGKPVLEEHNSRRAIFLHRHQYISEEFAFGNIWALTRWVVYLHRMIRNRSRRRRNHRKLIRERLERRLYRAQSDGQHLSEVAGLLSQLARKVRLQIRERARDNAKLAVTERAERIAFCVHIVP